MMKKNKQEEYIIIVNENFEIEAITLGLAQKLQINNQNY
jgi:hypothetical protein